jgi:exopolysaccharide biosynthesis polyprenyl glycosylphosphotransferase
MANGAVRELREVKPPSGGQPAVPVALPRRDVRARRPPALGFIIRLETLRRLVRVLTLMTLDVAGVSLAIFTALELKAVLRGVPDPAASLSGTGDVAPLACLITLMLFARSRLYADRPVRPGFARIISSLFQVMVIALAYALVEGERFNSYYIFYGSLFFALLYVSSFRWAFERVSGMLLRFAGYRRRAILVGSGSHIEAVARALKDANAGVDIAGFSSLQPRPSNGLKNLGPLSEIERYFDDVDEVLIADPEFPQDAAVDLVDRCHRHGVRVCVAPSTMEILMDRVEFVPGETVPLFELKPPVFEGGDWVVKRSFDLVVSVLLLIALSPFLALMALAVKLGSRGPVIYRSIRPGIGGVPFACFKFRTMYADAETRQAELEEQNEQAGALFKIRQDPRVTPVGALLRRFSLDELPQLVNVLRGEMSLVGPRPLPMRDYARLDDWHRKRYLVLPGITGLWQVSGRSELDFDELVRLDFLYLERWSVFVDLTIMLKTIPAVIRARGAW